jgi:hypothetical protein
VRTDSTKPSSPPPSSSSFSTSCSFLMALVSLARGRSRRTRLLLRLLRKLKLVARRWSGAGMNGCRRKKNELRKSPRWWRRRCGRSWVRCSLPCFLPHLHPSAAQSVFTRVRSSQVSTGVCRSHVCACAATAPHAKTPHHTPHTKHETPHTKRHTHTDVSLGAR